MDEATRLAKCFSRAHREVTGMRPNLSGSEFELQQLVAARSLEELPDDEVQQGFEATIREYRDSGYAVTPKAIYRGVVAIVVRLKAPQPSGGVPDYDAAARREELKEIEHEYRRSKADGSERSPAAAPRSGSRDRSEPLWSM